MASIYPCLKINGQDPPKVRKRQKNENQERRILTKDELLLVFKQVIGRMQVW